MAGFLDKYYQNIRRKNSSIFCIETTIQVNSKGVATILQSIQNSIY